MFFKDFVSVKRQKIKRGASQTYDTPSFAMSEFSLILVLQKENKQNSNMTWQKYKLNLRNSHLLEEFFQSWLILDTITKIMAPILCFTGDEIWLAMPHKAGDDDRNVLFNDMNGVFADYALSADEMAKWEKIIEVRTAVNGALETARAEKKIGKSLEADVALTVPAEDAFLAEMDGAALADLLIVSKVEVTVGGELAVSVSEAAGTKCPRCWKHSTAADENGLCPRCASVIAKCADFGEI